MLEKLAKHSILPEQRALLKKTSDIGVPNKPTSVTLHHEDVADAAADGETKHVETATHSRKSRKVAVATLVPVVRKPSSSVSSSNSQDEESEPEEETRQLATAAPAIKAPTSSSTRTTTASLPTKILPMPNLAAALLAQKSAIGDSTRPLVPPTEQNAPLLVVRPNRPPLLAASRLDLPVCGMEQEIVEAIQANSVVLLCGETGSGKTTQVPQFLLEAGFGCLQHPLHPGRIAVCQPRRVAAISMARRVAEELGVKLSALAAQQGDR